MGDAFSLVLAAHLIGDFVAQTDWQAANKETSWRADLAHVLTYHLILAVLVLPVWHDWRAALFLGISASTHAFVDRRWPTRLLLGSTRSKNFAAIWGVIAADQAIHLSVLAISFYWVVPLRLTGKERRSMEEPDRVSGLDDVVVAATELSLVDGEAGRLVYRGHDATELAETRSFEEVWHLLFVGHLPSEGELRAFRERVRAGAPTSREEHEAVRRAASGEPLSAVRSALSALASVRELRPWLERSPDGVGDEALGLGGAMPSLVALVHAELAGGPLPRDAFDGATVAERYLAAVTGRAVPESLTRTLDRYLVLTADHGMNASTFVARSVASTGADVGAALVAAVAALSGPLHGGAPGPVLDMLDEIREPARAKDWIARRVREGRRIMGFGHRVYRTEDPRARTLRRAALAGGLGRTDLAVAVEQAALEVLVELKPGRPLHTNVEFWSAVTFEACGVPRPLFTATFATSRMAGWTAHLSEQVRHNRLVRPRAAYIGPLVAT